MTFSEGHTKWDNTNVPWASLIVAFRYITRDKTNQAPRGEIENVVHQEVHYTTRDLNDFTISFKQKSGKNVREWILKVCNSSGGNIKLDHGKFADMGPLSWDFRFNMEPCTIKKFVKSLSHWLKYLSKMAYWKGVADARYPLTVLVEGFQDSGKMKC